MSEPSSWIDVLTRGWLAVYRWFAAFAALHATLALTILAVSVGSGEARASGQVIRAELNGRMFYIPRQWQPTLLSDGEVKAGDKPIQVKHSIIIRLPRVISNPLWKTNFPEIRPPFIFDLSLSPGVDRRSYVDPRIGSRFSESFVAILKRETDGRAPDADGFIKRGDSSYLLIPAPDVDDVDRYLDFSCQADVVEKQRGVFSLCIVNFWGGDGINARVMFDGIDIRKPQWRDVLKRTRSFIRWLSTAPAERSATFND